MTILIILITVAVSYVAFKQTKIMDGLQFNASKVFHQKELHRLVTHGFVHANWEHLLVNMVVLYSFGTAVESIFKYNFGQKDIQYYIFLYFGGMIFSNAYALIKYKNIPHYNAVGASGAVSAVLFAAIFFDPWNLIYFFGILPIPGIVFAVLYLAYSYYMSNKKTDNVAHDAHFLGAFYGFVFPIFINMRLLERFLDKLFMVI